MIQYRFLTMFALGALLWSGMALGFIWVVDPYGVSPVKFVKRVNHFKPMRVDIDRLIKPYEVWRYQPRTVFLGTYRIHQSMDPAALDGTDYAPAYNAAIPASMLDMTVAKLELYLQINKQLKHVFVELFLYSFIYPQSVVPRIGYAQLLDRDGMHYWNDPLHFSLKMGRQMIKAMLGTPDPAVPPNFMRRLNRQNVEALLTERRSGLEDWALRNRDFVEAFEHAKQASGKPPVQQPGAGS